MSAASTRLAAPRSAWRCVLDASDGLIRGGDPKKSSLCGCLRLWSDAHAHGRGRVAGESAAPDRGWQIVVKDRYPSYIDWPTDLGPKFPPLKSRVLGCLEPN